MAGSVSWGDITGHELPGAVQQSNLPESSASHLDIIVGSISAIRSCMMVAKPHVDVHMPQQRQRQQHKHQQQ